MISQTVNNKRYSPVSRNICITQCNSQKKDTGFLETVDSASIPIFTFLYTKSRRYAMKPAYLIVTCKAELQHRAIITLAQPSVLDPCYKNGTDALVRLLLLLQTLHCTASCTLGSVHLPRESSCGRRGTDETHKGRGGSSSLLGRDPHSILGKIMVKG